MHPVLVQSITVTDQNTFPATDQGFKGILGAMSVDHEIGDHRTGHYPEPVEFAIVFPWGFVNMVHLGGMCFLADRLIMRLDSVGGPVKNAAGSAGELLVALTVVTMMLVFLRFLYQRKIFLRL